MASRSLTSTPNLPALVEDSAARPARPHHRMSTRNRLLFFLTAWLIVLMPFLFWWSTWFGRHLSDTQITEYLNDDKHPRHIQHALVQLGERMARQDKGAVRWYPQLLRLASHLVEEVRNTDAWVMGQDTSAAAFHETLLARLHRLARRRPRRRHRQGRNFRAPKWPHRQATGWRSHRGNSHADQWPHSHAFRQHRNDRSRRRRIGLHRSRVRTSLGSPSRPLHRRPAQRSPCDSHLRAQRPRNPRSPPPASPPYR